MKIIVEDLKQIYEEKLEEKLEYLQKIQEDHEENSIEKIKATVEELKQIYEEKLQEKFQYLENIQISSEEKNLEQIKTEMADLKENYEAKMQEILTCMNSSNQPDDTLDELKTEIIELKTVYLQEIKEKMEQLQEHIEQKQNTELEGIKDSYESKLEEIILYIEQNHQQNENLQELTKLKLEISELEEKQEAKIQQQMVQLQVNYHNEINAVKEDIKELKQMVLSLSTTTGAQTVRDNIVNIQQLKEDEDTHIPQQEIMKENKKSLKDIFKRKEPVYSFYYQDEVNSADLENEESVVCQILRPSNNAQVG